MTWDSTVFEHPSAESRRAAARANGIATDESKVTPLPEAPPGFQLLNEVGRGGMGIIYRAHDLAFDREIAVKVLQPRYYHNYIQATRFLEEARITGKLQHPGVPAVHQTGKLSDGNPYLVMKLIKGYTLGELIWKNKSSSSSVSNEPHVIPANYLSIFESICQAIGYAHAHEVLHRDLKPQNIMVGAFGEVQVMDWGLAKHLNQASSPMMRAPVVPESTESSVTTAHVQTTADSGLTTAGTVVGTPAYMAPEQSAGKVSADARADVFGLGAILCCLLTGKPPFDDKNTDKALMQSAMGLIQDAYDRLEQSGAEPEIINLAKRCLAVNRDDRPPNGEAVAKEVAQLRIAADQRAQQAELERAKTQVHAEELQYRRRLLQVIVAILLIGIAGAVVGIFYTRAKEKEALDKGAETQAVLDFMVDDLFGAARPLSTEMGQGRNVSMREVILASRSAIAKKFKDKPLTEATVRISIGRSFDFLGEFKIAMEDFERCLELREKHLGLRHIDTIQARLAVANLFEHMDQPQKALAARELAFHQARDEFGLASHTTQMAMNNLANSYDRIKRIDDAIHLREQVLKLTRLHRGEKDPFTLLCMNNLGYSYACIGRHQEALALLNEAIELSRKYLHKDHGVAIEVMSSKAECLLMMKQPEKAMDLYKSILQSRNNIQGEDHPQTLGSIIDIANCYTALGQHREAFTTAQEALPLFTRKFTDKHSNTLYCLYIMISSLHELQRDNDAYPWMFVYLMRSLGKTPTHLSNVYSLLCQYYLRRLDALSLEQTLTSWNTRKLSGYEVLIEQARFWSQLAALQMKTDGKLAEASYQQAVQLLNQAKSEGWVNHELVLKDKAFSTLAARQDFRDMLSKPATIKK